jgi:RTX calcium-binding nonapeptide repeat (4 copies)
MDFSTAITPCKLAVLAVALAVPLSEATPATANMSAGVSNNTLNITSDGFSEKVALRRHPADPNTVDVDLDDDGDYEGGFARATFDTIRISMGGGSDSVRIDNSNGSFTDDDFTVISGEGGSDKLAGGTGGEFFIGGFGADTIDGGPGDDSMFGSEDNDTFIWNPGDGSDVVEGQTGIDLLEFNGSSFGEHVSIARNEAPRLESTVRLDRNVEAVTTKINRVEKLDLNTFGGADVIDATPDVGELIGLDIDAGSPDEGDLGDGDVVHGSDAVDVIATGPNADAIEARGGNDILNAGSGDDTLSGGVGNDSMTGGPGSDIFHCEGPGEVLDLQPEDLAPSLCIAAPAPAPAPGAPVLPAGFLGFGKPVLRATRDGLRVTLRSTHSEPITVRVRVSERYKGTARSARTGRYRIIRKAIPASGRVSMRLRAPRALRTLIVRDLKRLGRVARRPSVTVTNVATDGKRSVKPRLTLRRR